MFCLPFAISILLSPVTMKLSAVTGAIDIPSDSRRMHSTPMPRLGGLAFFAAFAVSALIFTDPLSSETAALISGGAIIAALGVSDDIYPLPPGVKLIGQCCAAYLAVSIIDMPNAFGFGFDILMLPQTACTAYAFIKTVTLINALNFSDGLDGLAAGESAVFFLATTVYTFFAGNPAVFPLALILLASVIGFIPFNRYRAKTFMGDTGSQFLGYAIAVLTLTMGDGVYLAASSLFIPLPMADMIFSVSRRILSGKNPFRPDKGHIHHRLVMRGFSHPGAVRFLVAVSAVCAGIGVYAALLHPIS